MHNTRLSTLSGRGYLRRQLHTVYVRKQLQLRFGTPPKINYRHSMRTCKTYKTLKQLEIPSLLPQFSCGRALKHFL